MKWKCGLCGYRFEPTEAKTACASCPLVKGCRLVRCPRCGYEMPPETKLVSWLRRLRRRSERDLPRSWLELGSESESEKEGPPWGS